MGKKAILTKILTAVIDLLSAFILPMVSTKLKAKDEEEEMRKTIKEEVRKIVESH